MRYDNLTEVANCATTFEAELIRNILDEHGIWAVVDGADLETLLSYIGSALGGVKVLVEKEDLHEARQLVLSQREPNNDSSPGWYCHRCQEAIEPGFDLCWSCGQPRELTNSPIVDSPSPIEIGTSAQIGNREEQDRHQLSSSAAQNQSTAEPETQSLSTRQTSATSEINSDAEEMLIRAWRASIFGLFLLPVILHLYSMFLLLRASAIAENFTDSGNRRFYATLVINVVAPILWIWMIFF